MCVECLTEGVSRALVCSLPWGDRDPRGTQVLLGDHRRPGARAGRTHVTTRGIIVKIRKLVAGAAVAGLAFSLLPQQAQAAEGAAFVFTAGATVSKDFYAPGLGPSAAGAEYNFGTTKPGIGGQTACVGTNHTGTLDTSCSLSSRGTVLSGLGNVGAFCGYSSGKSISSSGTVAGVSLAGLTIEWPQSAGTVLPLTYKDGATIVGVGAVQTTGAAPGTCGVGGPTQSFAVTGWTVLATP